MKGLCSSQLLFLIIIIGMSVKKQTGLGAAYGGYLLKEIG